MSAVFEFRRDESGVLEGRKLADSESNWVMLQARLAFPLSYREGMISLRLDNGDEWGFLTDVSELEGASKEALLESIKQNRFLIEITKVHEIELQHDIRLWKVETSAGDRVLPVQIDHWPRPLSGGEGSDGWIISDVYGDLYRIPPLENLDETSRKLLWFFVG